MSLQQGNIELLAKLIQTKKEEDKAPFVLVLGAGASLSSKSPSLDEIIIKIQEISGRSLDSLSEKEIRETFYSILQELPADERYLLLRSLFEKATPSMGYLQLAGLVKEGYFKYILTTNFDWLLEEAFVKKGLIINKDYAIFIVGKDEEAQILRQLRFPRPPVKVLKLHGDLSARIFKFIPEEISEFPERLEEKISELLSQDIVIVGYSMRDADLNRCIRGEGGAIWYINPEPPQVDTPIGQAMKKRKDSRYISNQYGKFDAFFVKLYSLVMGIPPEELRARKTIIPEAKEQLERKEAQGRWEQELK